MTADDILKDGKFSTRERPVLFCKIPLEGKKKGKERMRKKKKWKGSFSFLLNQNI